MGEALVGEVLERETLEREVLEREVLVGEASVEGEKGWKEERVGVTGKEDRKSLTKR